MNRQELGIIALIERIKIMKKNQFKALIPVFDMKKVLYI
jgi:hypothetical protein